MAKDRQGLWDWVLMVFPQRGLRLWRHCNFLLQLLGCQTIWKVLTMWFGLVWFPFLSMQLADTGRCWDSSFETREGCTTSHFKTANSEGKFWSCHPRISAAISQPGLNLWQVPAAGHYYTFHYRGDDERCKLLAFLALPLCNHTCFTWLTRSMTSLVIKVGTVSM